MFPVHRGAVSFCLSVDAHDESLAVRVDAGGRDDQGAGFESENPFALRAVEMLRCLQIP